MNPAVLQQLEEIYEALSGAKLGLDIGLKGSAVSEELEQRIISSLTRLRQVAESQPVSRLVYHINEALETFDIEYILNELESLLGY